MTPQKEGGRNASAGQDQVTAIPSGVNWALVLARNGFKVFPIVPGEKTPYRKETINQAIGLAIDHPGGFHHGTNDENSIRAMWSGDRSQAWVGIATGVKSGVYVLDCDRKDGKDGLETLRAQSRGIPPTVWCNTPSGGVHCYFKIDHSSAQTFKSDSEVLGPGVDRRGDGGYVVYYGADLNQPMAPTPDWMLTTSHQASGERKPLGTMQGPNFDTVRAALFAIDPNSLGYDDWRNIAFAYRQAATGLTDDTTIRAAFDEWCSRYE